MCREIPVTNLRYPRDRRSGRERGKSQRKSNQRARNRYVRVALTHPYRVGLLTENSEFRDWAGEALTRFGVSWAIGELHGITLGRETLRLWTIEATVA
jgi:hypothetical protein